MCDRSRSTWALAGLAALAMVVSGCSSEDFSGVSDQQVQTGVQESVPVALNALSMTDGAYSLVGGLLGQIGTGTAASTASPELAALPALACNASFDLGNGVTGTCELSDEDNDSEHVIDTATLSFHGTLEIDGLTTTINSSTDEGTLALTLPQTQPASGTKCVLTFAAFATNTRWRASWGLSYTAVVDDLASLADLRPPLNLSITPAGGSAAIATITMSPVFTTVSHQAPSGLNVSWVVAGETGAGFITANGSDVATVTIVNDCATINYDSSRLTDETICRT